MDKPHLALKGGVWRAYPAISTCRKNYLFFGVGRTPKDAISSLRYIQNITIDLPFRMLGKFC